MSWQARQESEGMQEVWVVLVTYQPDLVALRKTLKLLRGQVAGLVVVDNGSDSAACETIQGWFYPQGAAHASSLISAQGSCRVCLIQNDSNRGLALAQNQGIDFALSQGAAFVWFLDQDSLPQQDSLFLLLTAFETLSEKHKVAAVGPRYSDPQSGHGSRFVRFGWLPFQSVSCQPADEYLDVDFLISSGSLVCRQALQDVGLMYGVLFIDHVDTDWCLRARHLGWRLFGVCRAVISHNLGSSGVFLSWPRRRRVALHAPARHYYVFRNSIWLMRRGYAPLHWKVSTVLRLVVLAGFYLIFAPDRLTRLAQIWRGVRAGLGDFREARSFTN
jgi:rhamnosyltransferase